MSASREKKIRQVTGKQLTEKQMKALQAQKKAKRNTVIYTVVGVVCAVLAAALLIWNSGFFQKHTPALTIGGKNYPAVDVQYYYGQIANEWYSYAGYLGNLDPELPPDEQMYSDTQTWHDMFLESAISSVSQYKAVCQEAEKNGVTLTKENKQAVADEIETMRTQAVSSGYADFDTYLKTAYGSQMTEKKFEELYTEAKLAFQYAQEYSGKQNYTDEDLENYYQENKNDLELYRYGYAFFDGAPDTLKDADGNTITPTDAEKTAAMDAAKKKAEAFKAELEKGTSYEEAAKAYEEDDKVEVTKQLSYSGGNVSSLYKEWVQDPSRKQGDVTLVENSNKDGYYVIRFDYSGRDPEISGDVRHVLIAAEVDEGATVPTEAQYEAAKKKAEDLLAQWKKDGATEEAFAEMAKKESADTGSAENGGLYEKVTTTQTYVTEFANWAVDPSRKTGDTGIIKNTGINVKGYHIMYYVGQNEPLWKMDARNALKGQATTKWIEGLVEAANVTRGSGLKYVG